MNLECKSLYLFLLHNGFKVDDLFSVVFSTPAAREAYNVFAIIVVGLATSGSNGFLEPSEVIGRVDSFVEKYSLGCKMKLCEDFKPEK